MIKNHLAPLSIAWLLACASPGCNEYKPKEELSIVYETKKEIHSLPFDSLSDLNGFQATGGNWKVGGDAVSGYSIKHNIQLPEGTGVIANLNDQEKNQHLKTNWEHGDLELDLEFLMPKGSNSGIYFQGRYEIQLYDSWGAQELKYSDCGAIYQRWDASKPDGQQGYEGNPPSINAAKAPGLWQHFNILFRAPRFDENGKKIANARFERVIHNGVLVQENVEVTGPTRGNAFGGEVEEAPLVIQGDHGPVAFKNIRYKRFSLDEVTVSGLEYTYYEGDFEALPDFETLTPIKSGSTTGFYPKEHANSKDLFALSYTGKMHIPVEGNYIFHTISNKGSKLYINNVLVVNNDGMHDQRQKSGLIKLSMGLHDIRVDYFEKKWGFALSVMVEGPGIDYTTLASEWLKPAGKPNNPIVLEPSDQPEMQRCFMEILDKTYTHAIAVGNPLGVHYAIDLKQAALLCAWKGSFADVTDMWHSRGQAQLLKPRNMYLTGFDGPAVAPLNGTDDPWPKTALTLKKYILNESSEPVFNYELERVTITDHFTPDQNGQQLKRTITVRSNSEKLSCRLASASKIDQIQKNIYRIDGGYYILTEESDSPIMREINGKTELILPIDSSINYSILW